ncbi:MAG: FecR domain-containing protein [Chitinophagaceae bacterium]|nr:FecR domain-containing protein [Chitinophagaceae bacterium]MCW5926027.1 FecR domain-containing protein [Chitinophagaceae bacterium]
MHKERLLYLLDQYFHKTITPEEQDELCEMMTVLEVNVPLEDWMREKWLSYMPHEELPPEDADRYFSKIVARIEEKSDGLAEQPGTRLRSLSRSWARVAAVLIIAIAAFAIYLIKSSRKDNSGSPEIAAALPGQDVAPGGNFATLTLADGSTVILDSLSNGVVASQGSAQVIKLDNGEIKYESGNNDKEIFYNTMTTPTGGQYRLVLPDGTGVWLNVASSVTYPTAFTGKERNVSITGEVYFEVVKKNAMPFKVKAGNQLVEVLGTHFNINAYDNEQTINTTLAEGKVKVTEKGSSIMLQPDQQVQNNKEGKLTLVEHPDMEETLAWKDGLFHFNGTDIETIMRQVSRWYGVEVIYKDRINELFVADIPRNVNVSKLLELLELTKQVRFIIKDRTITVTR